MTGNISFWFDSSNHGKDPAVTVFKGDADCDIAIIGGGITGLSSAYHLKRLDPGMKVVLLESAVVGFGASGRNAGQLVIAFGENRYNKQLARYGAERLGEAYNYVAEGVNLIKRVMEEHQIDIDYNPSGYMQMALGKVGIPYLDGFEHFIETIGQGSHFERLAAEQVSNEFDGPYFSDALYDKRGGEFNPLKLVRALKTIAAGLGAEIYEGSPAIHFDHTASRIDVTTPRGCLRCDRLVLATNGYTHLLHGLDDLSVSTMQRPGFPHAQITEPLSAEQWKRLKWPRRNGVNIMSPLYYSFAPTRDGRILYLSGFHRTVPYLQEMNCAFSPLSLMDAPRHLEQFFPQLAGVRTENHWGGPISLTLDYIPHVGVSQDGRVAFACGYWGHGIPIGAHNGRTIAELLLGRNTTGTDAWFVKSSKKHWPHRNLAGLMMNIVAQRSRRKLRKMGRAMDPPLIFSK